LINDEPVAPKMTGQAGEDRDGSSTILNIVCELCSGIFNGNTPWTPETYVSHHNIHALVNSADSGCHLCSLILAQLSQDDITCLTHDWDRPQDDQPHKIGINVRGGFVLDLWVAALNTTVVRKGWDTCTGGWIGLAKLRVRLEKDDFTTSNTSTSWESFSNSSLAQVSSWLESCQSSHAECRAVQAVAATQKVLPTRLLDLSNEGQIRLCNSEALRPGVKYATLSHCWGVEKTDSLRKYKLFQNELALFETGLATNLLPQTFQDAILVTRRLGLFYLWIDALW
jgi:hypothetical protein